MGKLILVTKVGGKQFRITVPDEARITFGPWSPPMAGAERYSGGEKALTGTLRIYTGGPKASENILAVFSGVESFRDVGIDYEEQVAVEKGAVIWESDKDGYHREENVKRSSTWVDPVAQIAAESGDDTPKRAGRVVKADEDED